MIIGYCKNCKKKFRKREQKYIFCSLKCANGYNKNGLNKVVLPHYNSSLAEFVGICLGDGCASQFQVTVSLNATADKEYISYVFGLVNKLFTGATVSIVNRDRFNMVDLKINSILVSNFMKKNGIISNNKSVPKWIFKKTTYTKSCIRGLFDTEGSISFKIYRGRKEKAVYKQLNFTNYNLELMRFVRDSLLSFGFRPTLTLKRSLYLSTHEEVNRFRKKIGFSNPKLLKRSLINSPFMLDAYLQKR